MFNNLVIDVFIGLIFVFIVYSMLASVIQEFIATTLKTRSKMLINGIIRMLDDEETDKPKKSWYKELFKTIFFINYCSNKLIKGNLSYAFFDTPRIKYTSRDGKRNNPSYIHPADFSGALIDIFTNYSSNPNDQLKSIQDFVAPAVENPKPRLKTISDPNGSLPVLNVGYETLSLIRTFLIDAGSDVSKFRSALEQWYNNMMERVNGWYKRQVQVALLVIGIIIAIAFDVDSIEIERILVNNNQARNQMTTLATTFIQHNPDSLKSFSPSIYDSTQKNLNALADTATSIIQSDIANANKILGLNWGSKSEYVGSLKCFFSKVIGWLITALAISLGAPFWFDLLNRFVKLRGTGTPPTTTSTKLNS